MKRYSPACTRLLSQYKTMVKLVGSDVPNTDEFMKRYRVRASSSPLSAVTDAKNRLYFKMDHPAALHRIKAGVPATVEHSSEAGPETGKWIAETTEVRSSTPPANQPMRIETFTELHYFYGWPQAANEGQRSATSYAPRTCHPICQIQGEQRLGRAKSDGFLVCILLLE